MYEHNVHAPLTHVAGSIAPPEGRRGEIEGACAGHCKSTALTYWCETCQRAILEKRCPGCGLKARKVLQSG